VVHSPDHPELISGPDVLIGGKGRITAVFRVASSTPRRLLEARFVATRLALPAGSSLVAVVDPQVEPPRYLAEHAFDVVLGDSEIRDLVRLCTLGQPERRRLDDLRRVQQQHAVLYSTVLQIAELRQQHTLKASDAREVVANLKSREPVVDEPFPKVSPPTIVREFTDQTDGRLWGRQSPSDWPSATVKQTTVAALPDSKRRSIMSRIRPLWSEALSADFVLDMGVPYQRAFQPRVLLVDAWPTHRFDPRKPARAAAFSSWLMAVATTPEEIETLVDRTLEITTRRIRA